MKKYLLIILFFLSPLFGMEYDAKVATYFLPEDKSVIFGRLMQFLDSARHKVYIAIYELTDQRVADKLVELKNQKGIDVQVVLDDAGIVKNRDNSLRALETLLHNNIPTVIDLSQSFQTGIMHNKYAVVDGSRVWTGSANFTYPVLGEQGKYKNEENIVIIESPQVAQLFEQSFRNLRTAILQSHIRIIADHDISMLDEWLIDSINNIYAQNLDFKSLINSKLSKYDADGKNRLYNFFPDLRPSQKRARAPESNEDRPISETQRKKLEEYGIDTRGMSYNEAFPIVGKIMRGIPVEPTVYEDSSSEEEVEEGATQAQMNYIRVLGGYAQPNLSKSQASSLINQLKRNN